MLRSSKTRSYTDNALPIALPRIPNSPACPTVAWEEYAAYIDGVPTAPAFTLINGVPLTPKALMTVVKRALEVLNSDYAHLVSSHSIRRGGAQAAQAAGAEMLDIQAHGTWKSKGAMKTYVPNQCSTRVASSLATLFASKGIAW